MERSDVDASPAHLLAYATPCPPDLAVALRALRPESSSLRLGGLSCRCGEPALLVGVAYNWEVVDAGCPACGHEFSVFDPKHHGLLGARGRNDYERPPFESVPFGCMCRMMLFQLAFAVDYTTQPPGGEEFSFLAVAGQCVACGMTNVVLEAHCD